MKTMPRILLTLLLLAGLVSCRDTSVEADREVLLVAMPWKLNRVTDAQGQAIPLSRLNVQTQALFGMDFQFRENNITRATDRLTRQVLNGGTWFLRDNNTALDIEVSLFKGRFPLVDLNRSKLVLQNKMPINGVESDTNLEFVPAF